MRVLIIPVLLILSFHSFGQTEVLNSLTSNHVNVEGTIISLVPPTGWTKAINFDGFQDGPTGSSIMVIEIPGPFLSVLVGLTKEGLLTQGIILEEEKKLTINGMEGRYVIANQLANGSLYKKYILVFGNEKTTFLINGIFLDEMSDKLGIEIEKSLLSVVHEPGKILDPLNSVNFEVDVSSSKFKFAQMISNTLLYTVDGLVPTKSDDKTILVVGTSICNKERLDKKEYSINRMKQNQSIVEVLAEKVNPIRINDMSGYEIIALGIDDKTQNEEMVFQVMLFDDKIYYLIMGIAQDNFEENTNLFRRLTKTFKRK